MWRHCLFVTTQKSWLMISRSRTPGACLAHRDVMKQYDLITVISQQWDFLYWLDGILKLNQGPGICFRFVWAPGVSFRGIWSLRSCSIPHSVENILLQIRRRLRIADTGPPFNFLLKSSSRFYIFDAVFMHWQSQEDSFRMLAKKSETPWSIVKMLSCFFSSCLSTVYPLTPINEITKYFAKCQTHHTNVYDMRDGTPRHD